MYSILAPFEEGLILFTKKIPNRMSSVWRRLIASDLGTGSTGGGTKYLADDMTWKTVSGGYAVVNLNFASSPYTVIPITGTYLYNVDCTGGNIVINFPTAVGNTAIYGIKKIDSSVNTITLTPNVIETLDQDTSKTILFQNTQVEIYSDNTNLYLK
jgi:hypothetical protein